MKSQSTIKPNKVIESNGIIYIVDINSIMELKQEQQATPTYTYDMYELKLSPRQNMMEYIESNYDILLDFAINSYLDTKMKPSQEEIDKANREIEIINLLTQLEVIV